MNKLLIQIIPVAYVITTLVSCSKQSTITLTKRHYRSGYYIDFGAKKPTVNSNFVMSAQKTDNQAPKVASAKTENFHVTNNQEVAPLKFVMTKKNKEAKGNVKYKNELANYNSSEQNIFIQKSSVTNRLYAPKDEIRVYVVNVPFIVILLCAIFIPPLGVGLMYGINIYFWIDLVLTLLFFIPGLIFSLVVVLM